MFHLRVTGKITEGTTYGGLTAIGRTERKRKSNNYYWTFRCHCGKLFDTRPDAVKAGRTKSCGCTSYDHIKRTGPSHMKWTGYGEISGNFFSSCRGHARKRSIPFEISIEQAWEQFLKQDRKCVYTGEVLTFAPTSAWDNLATASIDRIDSSKSYTIDNIQWVHKHINRMKLDHTEDYFIHLCKKVAEHRN